MKLLEQTELRQPSKGLILLPEEIGAHPQLELGAAFDIVAYIKQTVKTKYGVDFDPEIVKADGDYSMVDDDFDWQRNQLFDPFDCVLASTENCIYGSYKATYGTALEKKSRRRQAIKANVQPQRGTSNLAGEQSITNDGMVPETAWPSITPTMTEAEFFQPIPPEVDAQENYKAEHDTFFIPLPTKDGVSAIPEVSKMAMPFGKVRFTVNGDYTFNGLGEVTRPSPEDSHDIAASCCPNTDAFYKIQDSENPHGLVKFAPDYDFHYPTLIIVKKKSMNQLIKEEGSAAVYLQTANGSLFAITDSEDISGGDLLKTFSGTYGNAGIKHVPAGTLDKANAGAIKASKLGATISDATPSAIDDSVTPENHISVLQSLINFLSK